MGSGAAVPLIDPRTIVLLSGVMGGLMAAVLYFLQRNYPPSVKGLSAWASGTFVLFLAGLTAATRGFSHDLVSITLANLLIFSGVYLQFLGSERFFGLQPRFWPRFAVICTMTLVSGWFTVVNPTYVPRLMISIFIMSWMFAGHARLLISKAPRSFPYRFTLGVLTLALMSQVMRFATSWLLPVGTGIMDTTLPNLIYIVSYPFLMLLIAIGLVLMATDRVRSEFEHLASHDSLTNALTRRTLTDVCQLELERCKRHGRMMSILLIDIDHFKSINDRLGHQAGDRALVQFVSAVNTLLRSADAIGRLGGEEFVVVLPETSTDVARVVAERIRGKVAGLTSPEPFTVSIGVTTNVSADDTVDMLMARADRAMYQAKERGRDQVVLG